MDKNRIVSSVVIGRRVKTRRRELGLSQEALAAMLDVLIYYAIEIQETDYC